MTLSPWIAGLAAGLVAACGSEGTPPGGVDGGGPPGTDAGPPPEPVAPALAMAPMAGAVEPCRDGWRAIDPGAGNGPVVCDPWPESGRATCAEGEAHFPGEPGCVRVGTECPAGDWADDLPASGVVYVQPGATGGDGTRAMPFGSIGEAVTMGTRGATIALARGTYTEHVSLPTFA